jgi:hypothetical protein
MGLRLKGSDLLFLLELGLFGEFLGVTLPFPVGLPDPLSEILLLLDFLHSHGLSITFAL